MRKKSLTIFLFKVLPTGLISRVFGVIARMPFPGFLLRRVIDWYIRSYGVDRDEIDWPQRGFRSLDAFFTRTLVPGTHVVDADPRAVVSPVDARIDMFGEIIDGVTMMQAKGVCYSLRDLVPSAMHERFIDGSFVTLYLSPSDYHRIHAPAGGRVRGFFNIPGRLFTVQEFMVQGLPGLFSRNERLISYIETQRGLVAVCKIGAMNVGRITLSYDPIATNRTFRRRREVLFGDDAACPIAKGDELGVFHLGSTVIMLFEKDMITFTDCAVGTKVRVGQRLAEFRA